MFLLKVMDRVVGFFLLICMPIGAWSATNPISYSLTPSSGLPSITKDGNSYSVQYTFKNNLPFSETITQVTHKVDGIGFSVVDECSGKILAANTGTCIYTVLFQPTTSGPADIQLTLNYDKNVVPLPILSTTVQSDATKDIKGVATGNLPSKTVIGTGYPVEFTFTNISNASVTATSVTLTGSTSDFTGVVNGCLTALNPSHACTITGTYTPSTTGEQFIGATFNYSGGSVPLVTHTIAYNGGGSCASVDGSSDLLLPVTTYIYSDNVVKFKFMNNCDTATASLGEVNVSATLNGSSVSDKWITKGTGTDDTCSNQVIAANTPCYVLVSIVPQATGSNLKLDATVNYIQSSQSKTAVASTTAQTVAANSATNRIVTFVNQCSVPVWPTFYAGAVPYPSGYNCATSGCETGAVCASNGHCYYSNPPFDSQHSLGQMAAAVPNAAPDTMTSIISENNAGTNPIGNVLYNGQIAPRLGCTPITPTGGNTNSLLCTVNNCGGLPAASNTTALDGQCVPLTGAPSSGGGFSFNVAEVTMLRSSINAIEGVYDESAINGVTVPIEVKARGPYTTSTVDTAPYNNCNATGAPIQRNGSTLGGCGYDYSTPTLTPSGGAAVASSYRYVNADTPTQDCSVGSGGDGVCTAPSVCGLNYDPVANKIFKRCGMLEGYAAIFEGICTTNTLDASISALATDYKCSGAYGSGPNTGVELFGCSGSNGAGLSCYGAPNSNNTCCGCVNWWQVEGGSLPVPTNTSLCNTAIPPTAGYNPNWYSLVESQIQWVKAACPTAYAYQFDDPSSSYTCTVVNSSNNTIVTNYTVTFCPGGKEVSKILPS